MNRKPTPRSPRRPRPAAFGEVVESGLCLYHGHSLGKFSNRSLRYDGSLACVRCTAAAREGRMNLDLSALRGNVRNKALQFWSQVDIGWADECWEWQGARVGPNENPMFGWTRKDLVATANHHPQRVAMWLSWGDLGRYRVKALCGNRYCCNPYHLTPVDIGVHLSSDNVDAFELATDVTRLRQQVTAYRAEMQEREILKQMEDLELVDPVPTDLIEEQGDKIISFDSQHEENIAKVVAELMQGDHHSSLINIKELMDDDL